MKYRGIIFDLDGVICHTDKYHYQAWKQVADKLGHSIWIESEPGVGTTVFLGLGRVPVQAE